MIPSDCTDIPSPLDRGLAFNRVFMTIWLGFMAFALTFSVSDSLNHPHPIHLGLQVAAAYFVLLSFLVILRRRSHP